MQAGDANAGGSGEGRFASTHWTVVFSAAQTESPEAGAALEALCRAYWHPLYIYLRRRGHQAHEAQDVVQEFFARRVVTRQIFRGIGRQAGRFRTWLLNSLQNLVCNEWDRQHAQKRGGHQPHVPLECLTAENHFLAEPGSELKADLLYDRDWAMTLLDVAFQRLKADYERDGKSELFNELKEFLPSAHSQGRYAEAASRLGRSEAALKMAVSRMRREYGRLVRTEIRRTVSNASEEGDELRYLLSIMESAL